MEVGDLSVYLENESLPFLEDCKVDYHPDKFGGQLTIRAPNAKVPSLKEDSSIEEKINYYLYSEVNPSLASHGGEVSLVEVIDSSKAVLRFGGGCQGCGMVDLTLKNGVEKTLKDNIPEITEIVTLQIILLKIMLLQITSKFDVCFPYNLEMVLQTIFMFSMIRKQLGWILISLKSFKLDVY